MKKNNCFLIVLAVFITLLFLTCGGGEDEPKDSTYDLQNPIFRDRSTTDPAPFYDEASGYLYVVVGEDRNYPESGKAFIMPGWHLYKTKDMKSFSYVGPMLKSEDFPKSSPNTAWAAQLIKGLDGKYYFYVTTHQSPSAWPYQICVAVAYDIEGEFTPHDKVLITESEGAVSGLPKGDTNRNIDPTVFIDDDGQAYIVWCQINPRVAKLNSDVTSPNYMVEIQKPAKRLFQRKGDVIRGTTIEEDWKMQDGHQYEEGPWIYKRNEKYYLFFASGRIKEPGKLDIYEENISYAMADSMEGPWTDGVVISEPAPSGEDWKGNSFTIHPGVVDFLGLTYMFYHSAVLSIDPGDGLGPRVNRNVCVDYMYFDEDGKPEFLDGVRKPEGISVPPKK